MIKHIKLVFSAAVIAIAFLVVGCGGSGGYPDQSNYQSYYDPYPGWGGGGAYINNVNRRPPTSVVRPRPPVARPRPPSMGRPMPHRR